LQVNRSIKKFKTKIPIKKLIGPDLTEPGLYLTGPAHFVLRCAGWAFERADRGAPVVSGPGGRNGMKRPGPSDQVGIDGPGASSSSGHWTGAETLGRAGGAWGHTWGLSPATRTGRGGAGHSGDLNEGRHGRIWTPGRISRVRDGVGRNRCSTRTTLRCSWIKVEGRVRSRGTS
jgi:hypothetical protein